MSRRDRTTRSLARVGVLFLWLLAPGVLLLQARADLACGRGALQPLARLLWRWTGTPSWTGDYRELALAPGAALVAGGTLLLLIAACWRARGKDAWRTLHGPGATAIVLGSALGVVHWSRWWLWLLPATLGALLLPVRPARRDGGARVPAWVWVLLLILLGGLLRYAHIDRLPPGTAGHHAGHLSHAYRALSDVYQGLDHYAGQPSLLRRFLKFLFVQRISPMFLIDWLSLPILGWSYQSQRMVAAWIGLMTLPPVYLLGRRLYGRRAGLAAAGLLAVSGWHNAWCRYEGSIQIQNPLHQALGLLMILSLLEAGRHRWIRAVPLGLWLGASCLLHASSHALPMALVVMVLATAIESSERRGSLLAAGGLAFGLTGAVYLLRLGYLKWDLDAFLNTRLDPGHPVSLELVARNALGMLRQLFQRGGGMHIHYQPAHPLLDPVLLVLVPPGIGVAARRIRDRSNLLVLAAVLAALPPALLAPEPAPRRLITLLVPACLLGGLAWDRLARPLGRRAAWIGGLCLLAAGAFQAAHFFGCFHAFESERSYLNTLAAEEAERLARDHVVLVPMDVGLNAGHFEWRLERPENALSADRLILTSTGKMGQMLRELESSEVPVRVLLPDRPELREAGRRWGLKMEGIERCWGTPRAPTLTLLIGIPGPRRVRSQGSAPPPDPMDAEAETDDP